MTVLYVTSIALVVITLQSFLPLTSTDNPVTCISYGSVIHQGDSTKFILGHLTIDFDLRLPFHTVNELNILRFHIQTVQHALNNSLSSPFPAYSSMAKSLMTSLSIQVTVINARLSDLPGTPWMQQYRPSLL